MANQPYSIPIRDELNESLINLLSQEQYRKTGISTNELWRNSRIEGKDTFTRRLKAFKEQGIVIVRKEGNRKYIILTDDVERLVDILNELRSHYNRYLLALSDDLKNAKTEARKKEIYSDVLEEINHMCWMFGYTITLYLIKKSKTPIQRRLFWTLLLPQYIDILDKFISHLGKIQKNYIKVKEQEKWQKEADKVFEKALKKFSDSGDIHLRTDAPDVIQFLDSNLLTGGYIDTLRSGDYGHTRIQGKS